MMSLAAFVALCAGVAGVGAAWTNRSLFDWYPRLRKPAWNPPNRVFGPVWTVLYLLMAVAAWLVWRRQGPGWALALWGLQLALNLLWSGVFFGLRRPGWAAVEVVLFWLSIIATAIAFSPVSVVAALLLIPYVCWVAFAAVLNITIWRLNRARMSRELSALQL